MTLWQRRARLAIAVFAVLFAVVVFFAFRRRPAPATSPAISPFDPKVVVESTAGHVVRVKGTREDVAIDFEREVTYKDGSSRLMNVKVTTTDRRDGRVFTLTGREGQVTENPSSYAVHGDVRLQASDGLTAKTEHAAYSDASGVVQAPGPAQFSKGRISGNGVGLVYDKNRDFITILDKAQIHVGPGERGAGTADISSDTATYARKGHIVHFERNVKVLRGSQTTEAQELIAYLTADEQRLERAELRGGARTTDAHPAQGALQALSGRDMDLKYRSDGETLDRVVVTGSAAIQIAGEQGKPGRDIAARSLDIAFAPDGTTPTTVVGQDAVQVTLPPGEDGAGRTIRAARLESNGDAGKGLTSARFTGDVDYREKSGTVERAARSNILDAHVKPGMGAIEEAAFSGSVRFEQGALSARAAAAKYRVDKGIVELTGSEPPPGVAVPHVVNEQIAVDAVRIDLTLEGPKMKAAGNVKSLLQPAKKSGSTDTKLPAMLKQDQPVNVIADRLDYDGTVSKATYTGNTQLWQSETSIRGDSILIDDKAGDLSAWGGDGSVTTSVMLEQLNSKTQVKERVRSIGTAEEFKYEDAIRRATYVCDAHLSGPEGDVTAPKIELYLKPSGDELERAEAYEDVTLRESGRKTTGTRMTYFADDERYEMSGTPVKIVDECGGETVGKTLIFDKTADTIVLDGKKQFRTQSKGSPKCG